MSNFKSDVLAIFHPKTLAVTGSVVLAVGVFLPMISVSVLPTTFFEAASGAGVIVLALALLSITATLKGAYHWLWGTGFGSLIMVGFTLFYYINKLNDTYRELMSELPADQDRTLNDTMWESMQIEYGVAVMLVGAFLLLSVAILARQRD